MKTTLNVSGNLEEIFEICHFDFCGEEYRININKNLSNFWSKKIGKLSNNKVVIGLNTGCGSRWKTTLWPKKYWISLINILQKKNYFCL